MTNGSEAARMAVEGSSLVELSGLLGIEALVGFVVMIAGYLMFRWFEYLARSKGTLDRF